MRDGPASGKPTEIGIRHKKCPAAGTGPNDFWQATSRVPLNASDLSAGVYRIELTTRQPVYADLALTFQETSRPPLLRPLNMLAPTHFSAVIHLDSAASTADIVISPPNDKHAVLRTDVRRLGPLGLAAMVARRLLRETGSPRMMMQLLGQAFLATGNFKIGSTATIAKDPQVAYGVWQQIFESESERDRLRDTLNAVRGERQVGVLAVYCSALNEDDLLVGFLEAFGPDLAGSGPSLCKPHLLVIDKSPASLNATLREQILSIGGAIMEAEENRPPLQLVASEAERRNTDFVVFLDRPGRIADCAFDAFALEFLSHPDCRLVYADSDRIDDAGTRSVPSFTPEWSPEFFQSHNYIGASMAFRPSALQLVDSQSIQDPNAISFALALAVMVKGLGSKARRIPRVLFHEARGTAKQEMTEARYRQERKEVQEQFTGAELKTELKSGSPVRKLIYKLPTPAPLVSVIIPSKDNPQYLQQAADSVLEASYRECELVIVDNGSTDAGQHRLLQELQARAGVAVISDPRPFNFSAMNNLARRSCHGDVLVCLNDDTMSLDVNWLGEMVALAVQPGVGCVGALLRYPDGRVQHAGITLGVGTTAAHAFRGWPIGEADSNILLRVRREVSAVTGACLAVRASIFDEVDGFDEALPISFNDIDLCLKVRNRGYRNLFTPFAVLTHHESITRGSSTSPPEMERLMAEEAYFLKKWGPEVLKDPYYSPHLSSIQANFRMRLED